MSKLDPRIKTKNTIEFATNLMPGIMQAAMVAMQMGVEFNVQKSLTDLADQLDISDEVQNWFNDPKFAQRMQLLMQMGPQNAGKAQKAGNEINQNGSMGGKVAGPGKQFNQNAQAGANQSQATNQGAY